MPGGSFRSRRDRPAAKCLLDHPSCRAGGSACSLRARTWQAKRPAPQGTRKPRGIEPKRNARLPEHFTIRKAVEKVWKTSAACGRLRLASALKSECPSAAGWAFPLHSLACQGDVNGRIRFDGVAAERTCRDWILGPTHPEVKRKRRPGNSPLSLYNQAV